MNQIKLCAIMILGIALDLLLLIGVKTFKKIGPFGFTILAWAAIVLTSLALSSCFNDVNGQELNNTTKEEKTMIIRFFNSIDFDLPTAPGSIATSPTFSAPRYYFGINSPLYANPENIGTTLVSGINQESNLEIVRYRFRAVGATGLRVGFDPLDPYDPPNAPPLVGVGFGRKLSGNSGSVVVATLPYTFEGEWVDTSIKFDYDGHPGFLRPTWEYADLLFDTRKLDPSLYGTRIRLYLEIDVKCTPVGF